MIFNKSLSASEVTMLYYSSLRKYDIDRWELMINQTNLTLGQSYVYNVSVRDMAGNVNYTETRTIKGNSPPGFASVIHSPTSLDDLDPNVTVVVTANISDTDNNFDSAILQWKNASLNWSYANNVSMANLTSKGYYTLLNASFILPSGIQNNYTYRILAIDAEGDIGYSNETNLSVYWDCTWTIASDLEAAAGWDENKEVGNITINNTGDAAYSNNNCTLDFRLTYDLMEGRIYFDNDYIKPSDTYTICAKNNLTVVVNASFLPEIKQEDVVLTVNEFRGRSKP